MLLLLCVTLRDILFEQLGLFDLAAFMYRLSYCGSGLFQVAFSSVAIWSALFSFVFLKRKISPLQWLGILIVTFGLILSPLSTNTSGSSPLTGILLTLLGAQFYAISYILNEYISVSNVFLSSSRHFLGIKDRKKRVNGSA